MTDRNGVCKHGSLRRKCDECDLEEDVDMLFEAMEEIRDMIGTSSLRMAIRMQEIAAGAIERCGRIRTAKGAGEDV